MPQSAQPKQHKRIIVAISGASGAVYGVHLLQLLRGLPGVQTGQHLSNVGSVTEMGGIIFPPVPGFYQRPQTLQDPVDETVSRVLDLLGLPKTDAPRWQGLAAPEAPHAI